MKLAEKLLYAFNEAKFSPTELKIMKELKLRAGEFHAIEKAHDGKNRISAIRDLAKKGVVEIDYEKDDTVEVRKGRGKSSYYARVPTYIIRFKVLKDFNDILKEQEK